MRTPKHSDREHVLAVLANKLTINHFNVALTSENPSGKAARIKMPYDKVLDNSNNGVAAGRVPIDATEFEYTRNIVIIGAKASSAASDQLGKAADAIQLVEERLGIDSILNTAQSKLKSKYLELAMNHLHKMISDTADVEEIKQMLRFEGRFALLNHFFTAQDVSSELKSILDYRFIPNHFYEITAHLLKHRFVDVVINFNFDELLDNAIADEMGKTQYHRIISDMDYENIESLANDNRLRVPVYIKPHGTISNRKSMFYTDQDYLNMSDQMRALMKQVLSGSVGVGPRSRNHVRKFNIIMVGYEMNDLDMQSMLLNQYLSTEVSSINYFVWGKDPLNKVERIADKFLATLPEKRVEEMKQRHDDARKKQASLPNWNNLRSVEQLHYLEDSINSALEREFFSVGTADLEKAGMNPYDQTFAQLFDRVRQNFCDPFVPRSLNRHKYLSLTFDRKFMNRELTAIMKLPDAEQRINSLRSFWTAHFYARVVANGLFEMVKHGGSVDQHAFRNHRNQRYYALYRAAAMRADDEVPKSVVELFTEAMGKKLAQFVGDKVRCPVTVPLDMIIACLDHLQGGSRKGLPHNTVFTSSIKANYDALKAVLQDVFDTNAREINTVYNHDLNDDLYPYTSDQILSTNLALTWRFYEFAVIKSDWDELLVSDESGRCVYNLWWHSDQRRNGKRGSHLEHLLSRGVSISVLVQRDRSVPDNERRSFSRIFNVPLANVPISVAGMLYAINQVVAKGHIQVSQLPSHDAIRELVVFKTHKEPRRGIFMARNGGLNRVCPIAFDRMSAHGDREKENDENNLGIVESWFSSLQTGASPLPAPVVAKAKSQRKNVKARRGNSSNSKKKP